MIDGVSHHRVRRAAAAPYAWRERPSVEQALVEWARDRVGFDPDAIVAAVATLNAYERTVIVARAWRRCQPDQDLDLDERSSRA